MGCAARHAATRTDVPEPAVSPAQHVVPAGRLVPLAGQPEGMVVAEGSDTLAVGVRQPDGVALVSLPSGRIDRRVPLGGAPRHLQLAGPAGPLLVPAEGSDTLVELALPSGSVEASIEVGRQPHDAAATAGHVLVGNELADTVSVIAGGAVRATVPAPRQPGGVAASLDGSVALVVGVRARQVEAYRADGSSLGRAACGVGPTHVRAGPGGRFYVADTEGDQILVFEVTEHGPVQVGRVHTGGTPYGLAVDAARDVLYVTLTATNQLRSFHIEGRALRAGRTWPTPRQPNDVAVDPSSGQVVVAGTAGGVLQLIEP